MTKDTFIDHPIRNTAIAIPRESGFVRFLADVIVLTETAEKMEQMFDEDQPLGPGA